MNTVFALIDCNNFFVSCERLFRPDLEGRPVVVLSSNDGCAISRSNEAKALGIPMGAPAFKYRQLFKEQGVVQFSANFELYGDISHRLTRLLTSITPRTEVYSVDESFLDLSQLEITDYSSWGEKARKRILKEVGVPVAIGIAASKTLAKLADDRAKKDTNLANVLDLYSLSAGQRAPYLLHTPVKDVWGIGWRLAPRLKAEGVFNALELAGLRPQLAKQLMGVHGRQMVAELNGQPCHPLEAFGRVHQTIMKGRMFGEDTNDFQVVESAIASLGARAALALRRERLLARKAYMSLSTNRHKPGYQHQKVAINFDRPTADTGTITASLVQAAQTGFNPRMSYHRANILLHDFIRQDQEQFDLFNQVSPAEHDTAIARLEAFDALNERYGSRTIRYAAEDLSQAWQPRKRLISPRYTSNWDELPSARVIN